VGQGVKVPVHADLEQRDVVRIAQDGLRAAHAAQCDVVIVDTAGRLHVDDEMMAEVQRLEQALQPFETLLVVDAMTGQDAVNVATQFTERLNVSGFILTKLDGDTRGGAAISIRAVTGKPIKLAGVGEKSEAVELFHPERMASRILGMGDVISLIERAQATVDAKAAADMERKLRENSLTLEDFLSQMQQVRRMGPIQELLGALPGFSSKQMPQVDEKQFGRVQAIMQSMTRQERLDPAILNGSRRRRIARGSGTTVQEVNQLLSDFQMMRKQFGMISKMMNSRGAGGGGRFPRFRR
jgi:signal recognition particle subunit SRP54